MSNIHAETEVRAMRDRVYGIPSTDANWNACKENWLRPDSIEWLKEWVAANPTTDKP